MEGGGERESERERDGRFREIMKRGGEGGSI